MYIYCSLLPLYHTNSISVMRFIIACSLCLFFLSLSLKCVVEHEYVCALLSREKKSRLNGEEIEIMFLYERGISGTCRWGMGTGSCQEVCPPPWAVTATERVWTSSKKWVEWVLSIYRLISIETYNRVIFNDFRFIFIQFCEKENSFPKF